jgi:cytochrome b561
VDVQRQAEVECEPRRSRLFDGSTGYGWMSIALHWIAAAFVTVLWLLGKSIRTDSGFALETLHLHTSLALCFWVVLGARIAWRMRYGHPEPARKQSAFSFSIARVVHVCMLAALAILLLSGPMVLWLRGQSIPLFSTELSSPFVPQPSIAHWFLRTHVSAAIVLSATVAVHILAVFRHVAFCRDGTLDRMMVAREASGRR